MDDQFNPYDLSAIAKIHKKHKKAKRKIVVPRQPYEPEHYGSAYDLSNRPGDED